MSHPPMMLVLLAHERQRDVERGADAWGRRRADAFSAAAADRRTPRLLTRLRSWQDSLHQTPHHQPHHRWAAQHRTQEES
jgi:hypothetical protein